MATDGDQRLRSGRSSSSGVRHRGQDGSLWLSRRTGAARVGHRQQHFSGVSGHLGGQLRIGQAHRISIADHRRHATTGGSDPEVFVDLADGHRSLTDRRRHPFHRATAHVTRREHTGLAGFQHPRLAPGPATFFTVAIRVQRGRAGRDEAVVVELDGAGEARRVWARHR
jgi:hypothetical protein